LVNSKLYQARIITQDYEKYLNVVPNAAQIGVWQTNFANGMTRENEIASLMGSATYYNQTPTVLGVTAPPSNTLFVKAVYQQLFPWYTLPAGTLNAWLTYLANPTIVNPRQSMVQILLTETATPSYLFDPVNGLVNQLYLQYTGEAATASQIAAWETAFANGATDQTLIASLLRTSAYFLSPHVFP
jgi:hypothetical protein